MARPRNFEEEDVIALAAEVFGRLGYNDCSIDDLLEATGLQRGSLYKAFGSKRNLFEKVLQRALIPGWLKQNESLDLFIIALRELAPEDDPIAELCRAALPKSKSEMAKIIGERLLENLE
ncbi:helix-turn-helix domain-containing protein [Undibacterium sp. 5I1]|uniref:TetR/AcrR family transcriptional regulator n=1 Tax=unclassified Undibacterium TaxID=2630295 RepID=UPI002AB54567|nr:MULTISPECIES: helix-turn-helix domain-containing protein [unclassified Undibacterium]MDY7539606.1 helix-turn-helix domain-containing protein [Undibacterium sp. 5I1]MEB0230443.1 helix-turn-helix domain-containing protein [Undibacterium sp. 10I3]MEB0258495.1 helix-turn-helix domain-containing protein [Undibacterium sp. 5I1]